VALSQIWEANGNAATAGTSVTPTSTAISAVGDLLVASIVLKTDAWSNLAFAPLFSGSMTTPELVGRYDHSVGDLSVAIMAAVVTSSIASGSNLPISWTTNSTGRYGTVTCFRADESFDAWLASGVDDSVTAELASGTAFSGLADLDPIGSTGLGFRLIGKLVNNTAFTQGTGWTAIRNAGNTAPMSVHTSRAFRTDATAYNPDCSGFSSTGRKALLAVHFPTGSAPAAGAAPRRRALLGVGR
jgi:hypothetical protein